MSRLHLSVAACKAKSNSEPRRFYTCSKSMQHKDVLQSKLASMGSSEAIRARLQMPGNQLHGRIDHHLAHELVGVQGPQLTRVGLKF